MSKVYDCFLFNGEFELLEIRLKTHFDDVDQFVIIQGNRDFRGKDKKYFDIPKSLSFCYDKIKMIYFDVPSFKESDGAWLSMSHHRNDMIRGLTECNADDFVIFSEIDEIIRYGKIKEAIQHIKIGAESVVFDQATFCYYLNVRDFAPWGATRMLRFGDVLKRKLLPQTIRNSECFDKKKSIRLYDGGWHFQNLGGPERVRQKLKSSCHHELGAEEISNIDVVTRRVKNLIEPLERKEHILTVVDIDQSYPKCVYEEQEKYKHIIYHG